jgi:hypothetical protein
LKCFTMIDSLQCQDETTSRFTVWGEAWCAGCNLHYTDMQGTQLMI